MRLDAIYVPQAPLELAGDETRSSKVPQEQLVGALLGSAGFELSKGIARRSSVVWPASVTSTSQFPTALAGGELHLRGRYCRA